MKFRTDRAALADACTWVAGAIPRRPASPALGGIRLTASENTLTLSAYDFESAHQATISAEVVTDGDALLPGHMLRDLAAAMTQAEVELVVEERLATLSGGRATYRIPLLGIEDWPSLPAAAEPVGHIAADDLAQAVRTVKHAVDDDAPTEAVRGIMLATEAEGLRVVGLRGTVMSTCLAAWSGEAMTARVPASYLEAALKGLTGAVGMAEVNGLLTLADASRTVTMRCYAGDYARWTQLVRESSAVTARLEVDDFAGAVKRVTLTQPRDSSGVAVRVTVRPDEVEIAAGDEAVEVLDAVVSGLDDGAERTIGLGSSLVGSATAGLAGPVLIGIEAKDVLGVEFRMADDSSVHYLAPRRLLER